MRRWGQARLRSLLEGVDDSAWRGSDLVVQFSSVGLSRNQDGWLRQMAAAFCPHDALVTLTVTLTPTPTPTLTLTLTLICHYCL